MSKETKVYSKSEKQAIARRCGYEYVYSGKTGSGFFKEIEGTENVNHTEEDFKLLTELIAQEK